jgi:hypothetical protein
MQLHYFVAALLKSVRKAALYLAMGLTHKPSQNGSKLNGYTILTRNVTINCVKLLWSDPSRCFMVRGAIIMPSAHKQNAMKCMLLALRWPCKRN